MNATVEIFTLKMSSKLDPSLWQRQITLEGCVHDLTTWLNYYTLKTVISNEVQITLNNFARSNLQGTNWRLENTKTHFELRQADDDLNFLVV